MPSLLDLSRSGAMRLEDWLSDTPQALNQAIPAVKQAVTLPMGDANYAQNPTYRAADALSSIGLGIPVSQAIPNAVNNLQNPSRIVSRATKPMDMGETMGVVMGTMGGGKLPQHLQDFVDKATPEAIERLKFNLDEMKQSISSKKSITGSKYTSQELSDMKQTVNEWQNVLDMVNKKSQSPQSIIEQAGGKYIGNKAGMHWYNEPETQSTMVMKKGATVEDIKKAMEDKRKAFKLDKFLDENK
jgi:hypothetical protein